jgi:hypothetical protein
MDISESLTARLAALSGSLDGVDIETQIGLLAEHATIAVASYVGMTMTVSADGQQVSLTVHVDAARPIGASLRIPLDHPVDEAPPAADGAGAHSRLGSSVVLYASAPGAFVDLAADLSHALGLPLTAFDLDAHVGPAAPDEGVEGLVAQSAVNQAIGLLIGRGHTELSAHRELRRLADLDGGDRVAAAQQLLRDAYRGDRLI